MDTVAVVGLCLWHPRDYCEPLLHVARRRFIRLGFAFAIVLVSLALTAATLPTKPAEFTEDGLINGQGIVLLEPERWLGKRLPLLRYVKTPEDLSVGAWVLVLVHRDCPKCQAVLPSYEEMAREWSERGLSSRIAVIEIPAHRSAPPVGGTDPSETFCTPGRLTEEREWFVQTPALIKIVDGMVVEATTL
jgi:hypothetical protein